MGKIDHNKKTAVKREKTPVKKIRSIAMLREPSCQTDRRSIRPDGYVRAESITAFTLA